MSQADENTMTTRRWGELEFYPAKTSRWSDTCRHCLLWTVWEDDEDCLRALCRDFERADHRNGYFSIQQFPQQKRQQQ
ncbi:MAG: hypothetical protein IJU81_02640 [Bacteroidales bacterium]|nr:hypothetical protein [Bacteroidales bacterium]